MERPRRPGLASTSVVALTLVLAAAGGATAQGPAIGVEHDPELAQKLYQEAKELLETGQVRESLEKLQEAYKAYPNQAILVSIANRHLDLGEPEEAAEVLERIDPEDAPMKRQVARLRKELDRQLEQPVSVRVASDGRQAEVSIDGGPFREVPARVQLPRGSHRFTLRAAGRQEVTVTRELRGTSEIAVVVALPELPGRWRVAIDPPERLDRIRITMDGKPVPISAAEQGRPVTDPREIAPGTYKLTCIRGFEDRADTTLSVVTGQVAVATCAFVEKAGPSKPIDTWAWAAAGGAAASLIAGTAYLVSYQNDKEEFPPPRYKLDSSKPVASGVFFATGVGLGVLSAFLFAE